MIFELWDVSTANLVGSFATENEALVAVRVAITRHGRRVVRPWARTAKDIDQGGATRTRVQGARLAEWVMKQPAA
jgi:hypothetical protein